MACFAPAASAGPGDGPIVLTNKDIDRVRAEARAESANATEAPGRSGLIVIEPSGAHAEGGASGRELDSAAGSWQEEYYRLKALALKQAMENGEPVSFGDEAQPRPSETTDVALPARNNSYGAACVYDKQGLLVHTPEGMRCREHTGQRARPSASRSGRCLYGTRGELLYAPPGRTCPTD